MVAVEHADGFLDDPANAGGERRVDDGRRAFRADPIVVLSMPWRS
jgi:hypothetical protein